MKKFDIDKVENIGITLDTIKGLSQAVNDLTGENVLLFTNPDTSDKGTREQMDRLYSKLMALSAATIDMTENAAGQLNDSVSAYYKEGRR